MFTHTHTHTIPRLLKYSKFFSIFIIFGFVFLLLSTTKVAHAVNPDAISNLELWLDASQGVTTDGSTPAVDNDTVQQWNDQSTNSANATQTTEINKPTYKTSILNGNPVLRFDGSHSMVTASFLDSSFNTDFTFFIVTNQSDTGFFLSTSNQALNWYTGSDGAMTIFSSAQLSTTQRALYFYLPDQVYQDYGIESFRYDGATKTARLDDITASTTNTQTESTTGNLTLSGGLTIGKLSTGGFDYKGDIAEIIIYKKALSDVELIQIAQYLSTKYDSLGRVLSMTSQGISEIAFEGDSMTSGVGSTNDLNYPNQTITLLGGTSQYNIVNVGTGGQTVVQMIADASAQVDSLISNGISRPYNFLSFLGGTNDLYGGANATTTYNNMVSYLQGRRSAGFEVVVNTILPRSDAGTPGSFEADRQTINTLIRANWTTFADGISDPTLDSRIGDAGDELDTTYYADKVHMTNTGYGIIASYAAAAIKQIREPIAISNISAVSSTSTITWTTNQSSSTYVNYGLTSSYGSSTTETDTSTLVLNHSAIIPNLTPCSTYHYQTVSNDLNGNQVTSADQTFTVSCPSTAPTTCTTSTPSSAPLMYSAIPESKNSVMLKFSKVNENTDKYAIEYGTESGKYIFAADNIGDRNTENYLVESLAPNTTYYFRVRAGNGCATGPWSNEISARTTYGTSFGGASSLTNTTLKNLETNIIEEKEIPVEEEKDMSDETPYSVQIKVVDTNQKPIENATVELHSTPRTTTTDKNGIAKFDDVEKGDHRILIAYDGQSGEQKVTLEGDETLEFQYTIQIKPTSPFRDYRVIGAIIIPLIASTILFTLLVRKKKNKV